jgi:hypothetical protein
MEAIVQLEHAYFLTKVGLGSFRACIDWAIERLQKDEEGSDLDIVLLAASIEEEQAIPLVERIVSRYCASNDFDEHLAAGKYVAGLRETYFKKEETIASLDATFSKLYHCLDYPTWLVMLCRNCEYATDIPAFVKPFEEELSYIADLWESVTSRADFEARYSRVVSSQHDISYCQLSGRVNPIRWLLRRCSQLCNLFSRDIPKDRC